jgi:hypothetical protein
MNQMSPCLTTFNQGITSSGSELGDHILSYWSESRMAQVFGLEDFWKTTLRCIAQKEPAIRYALAALYAAQECTTKGLQVLENRTMLQYYNMAIRHLNAYPRHSIAGNHLFTVLIVCALFVCLEVVRGQIKLAIKHVQGGVKILREEGLWNGTMCHPSAEMTNVRHDLNSFFTRIRLQSILLDKSMVPRGFPNSLLQSHIGVELSTVESLADARQRLIELSSKAVGLILSTEQEKFERPITLEEIIFHHQTEILLDAWHDTFDDMIHANRKRWSQEEIKMANFTKIQGLCISIWLKTCLSLEQTAFDKYKSDFEMIIDLAEQLLTQSLLSDFQIDVGMIPALHFTGVKCRYPDLRRRALRVLGSRSWREGLFESHRVYQIVHRYILLEEAGIGPDGLPVESYRIHSSQLWGLLKPRVGTLKLFQRPSGLREPPVIIDVNIVDSCGSPPM